MDTWFRRLRCWLMGRRCDIRTFTETTIVEGESLPFQIRTQWYCATCGNACRREWRHKK